MSTMRLSQSQERERRRLEVQKVRVHLHGRSLHANHETWRSGKTLSQGSTHRRSDENSRGRARSRLVTPISLFCSTAILTFISRFGAIAVKTNANIRLKFSSEKKLQTILNSLKPEVNNPATTRARTILKKEDRSLVLRVEADDTVALRASLNAYLRWINSILNVLEVLEAR